MNQGIHQHDSLIGAILNAQSPVVRSPQVVTTPIAAKHQAQQDTRLHKFDQRLTAILRGMVEGFACDAADFYLLNDASNELVLRSHFEAAESEPGAARRPLKTARADVAAMSGSAIVLEDDSDVAHWPVPVWCGAALCLPVASDETIHGTLWLYSSEPRAFADAEHQLAEVVAGRLAVEMELQAWRATEEGRNDPASPSVAVARRENEFELALEPQDRPSRSVAHVSRPAAAPQLDEWDLAGWTPSDSVQRSFYDWQTLADGRTLVATGAYAPDDQVSDGWLQAARIALRAHVDEVGDAGELLSLANQTLWLASPGGEGLAVAVAMLEADGLRASVASAGDAGIARWRAASCDWIYTKCPSLGWSERTVYAPQSFELVVRERLVLVTAGGLPSNQQGPPNQHAQAKLAQRLRSGSPEQLRAMPGKRALRFFADVALSVGVDPAGLALVRRR